jgi:hypothetical protein
LQTTVVVGKYSRLALIAVICLQAMSAVWAAAEGVMDSMGMMRGNLAIAKRALFGAGVGYLAVQAVRPSAMYYDNGEPRPWSFSQTGSNYDGSGTGQHSATVPWWSVPLGTAIVFSQVI